MRRRIVVVANTVAQGQLAKRDLQNEPRSYDAVIMTPDNFHQWRGLAIHEDDVRWRIHYGSLPGRHLRALDQIAHELKMAHLRWGDNPPVSVPDARRDLPA